MPGIALEYGAESTLIASGAIANAATAASANITNRGVGYLGWWLIAHVTAGAGTAADGVTMRVAISTNGGSTYTDFARYPILTLPSPNGSAVRGGVQLEMPAPDYKVDLLNSSGAEITASVTGRPYGKTIQQI